MTGSSELDPLRKDTDITLYRGRECGNRTLDQAKANRPSFPNDVSSPTQRVDMAIRG